MIQYNYKISFWVNPALFILYCNLNSKKPRYGWSYGLGRWRTKARGCAHATLLKRRRTKDQEELRLAANRLPSRRHDHHRQGRLQSVQRRQRSHHDRNSRRRDRWERRQGHRMRLQGRRWSQTNGTDPNQQISPPTNQSRTFSQSYLLIVNRDHYHSKAINNTKTKNIGILLSVGYKLYYDIKLQQHF